MTKADLFVNQEGLILGFRISGHTGYSVAGSDIVCAGLSSLSITCVNALESVAGVTPEIHSNDDGYLEAWLPKRISPSSMHDSQVILSVLRQGLQDLTEAYPQYVKLSILERRETK